MPGLRSIAILFLSLFLIASQAARASEIEYKADFYSYDGPLRRGVSSHTFARFVKIVDGKVTEVVDISWMPEPGNLRRHNRMPLFRIVPGHNYTLEQTMAMAGGKMVLSHGSYYITPDIYESAVRQKAKLESGRIAYKMLDGHSGGAAINCIHAVAGVVGSLDTGLRRGKGATSAVVGFFLSTGRMSSRSFAPVPHSSDGDLTHNAEQ
jgi:hypothetical protein